MKNRFLILVSVLLCLLTPIAPNANAINPGSAQGIATLNGSDSLQRGLIYWAPLVASTAFSGSGSATFTRASTGVFLGSNGLLQSASSGAARFDYSGGTPGFLAEAQATNLLLQSSDLSNAAWSSAGTLTLTGGSVTDPMGGSGGTRIQSAGGANVRYQTITVSNSTAYTISGYIKAHGSTNQIVALQNNNFSGSDITVTPTWKRFSLTSTTTGTSRTFGVVAGSGNAAFDIDIWGLQLETGSSPTSYIATTSAAVTRVADTLSYPSSVNVLASQGTVSAWVYPLSGADSNFRTLIDLGGSGNNGLIVYENDGSNVCSLRYGSGATLKLVAGSALTQNTWNHIVAEWSSAGGAIYQAGALITSVATAPSITLNSPSFFVSNQGGTQRYANSLIDEVRIWNRVLSTSEIASLYARGVSY